MSGHGGGNSETVHFERERGVTEVQVTRGIAHVTVDLPVASLGRERLNLLKALAAENIPVFMVKLLPGGISFALRESVAEAGAELLRARSIEHTLLTDLGLVAVVAGAMRDLSGIMALIYQALVGAGVQVRQTGDAYNAVLCLVTGDEADKAAEALRDCFFQSPAATPASAPDIPAALSRKGL
jgi:aspartokinase